MALVIDAKDLPGNETSRQYEGLLHGNTNVAFFVSDTRPGKGPSLHLHPYAEIFIVLDGQLTFTVGEETIEAKGGQIVVVPPETPHKFRNSGSDTARHVDIHTNGQMVTTWLEV